MAAGNFTLYGNGHLSFFDGTFAFASDTVQCILLSDGYTPSAAHTTYADVSANEITDADYAPQPVAGKSVAVDGGVVTVDSDDISFGSSVTIEARYAAFLQQSGSSLGSSDLLIGYVDLKTEGGTVSSTNSQFDVAINAAGLFTDTQA